MNKADEIRDKLRQLRYLMDERKFIDDLLRKLEEQKNKLHLEALQIQALINEQCMYSVGQWRPLIISWQPFDHSVTP